MQRGEAKRDEVLAAKESLQRLEFRVLPTVHDKWVSMHPSCGLVCWCVDEKLAEEFRNMDGVELLYLGKDNDSEREMNLVNLSDLMNAFGIPALSEVRPHFQ